MPNRIEQARLDALRRRGLLDAPVSESLDRVARMAGRMLASPMAAVSFTGHDRTWFKSRVGFALADVARGQSPCARISETRAALVIHDLLADPDYATGPLAAAGVRFYAGVPLVTPDGHGLGALCVLGASPREVRPAELAALGDLAALAMAQIELERGAARIDPLSGLPNRLHFLDDVAALARDQPDERRLAVIVDLGRSEQLDRSVRVLGPAFLDKVVHAAAKRLMAAVGPGRAIYHVGAAQFALLARAGTEPHDYVALLAEHSADVGRRSPMPLDVSFAMGIVPFRPGDTPALDILRAGHSAAQDARKADPPIGIYAPANDAAHRRSYALLNDFAAALDDPGQLHLVFQPRVDLATGACNGAEALLRWHHPTLGEVSPGEFIPLVEDSVLARPLTAWVIDTALAQLAAWQAAGLRLTLSVNVSASNLDEADFAQRVQLYLLKHRVRPAMLELEVTECVAIRDTVQALGQLDALSQAGIGLAIDDFGTGYSSLAYLPRLPAQIVKIDRSFVRDLVTGDRERTLVQSMIRLLHDLGHRVVAEGIETQAAAAFLLAAGCEEAQGYLFARPLEAPAFVDWFREAAAREADRVAA